MEISFETFMLIQGLSQPERDALEERAGILEFSAGLPREEAEAQALDMIIKNQSRKTNG